MAKVADFRPATKNANKHSARGLGALTTSVQSDGWIGAMTTAADGEMIAGSARIETVAQVFGVDAEPIVIESDGTRPIIVRCVDIPQADDPRAVRLALADNRVQELDLSWDVEVLAGLDAATLDGLWSPYELSQLGEQWAHQQGDDPNAEWVGMPEFGNTPKAFRTIPIHFENEDDVKAFSDTIAQKITENTRSLWYPKKEQSEREILEYASES